MHWKKKLNYLILHILSIIVKNLNKNGFLFISEIMLTDFFLHFFVASKPQGDYGRITTYLYVLVCFVCFCICVLLFSHGRESSIPGSAISGVTSWKVWEFFFFFNSDLISFHTKTKIRFLGEAKCNQKKLTLALKLLEYLLLSVGNREVVFMR